MQLHSDILSYMIPLQNSLGLSVNKFFDKLSKKYYEKIYIDIYGQVSFYKKFSPFPLYKDFYFDIEKINLTLIRDYGNDKISYSDMFNTFTITHENGFNLDPIWINRDGKNFNPIYSKKLYKYISKIILYL